MDRAPRRPRGRHQGRRLRCPAPRLLGGRVRAPDAGARDRPAGTLRARGSERPGGHPPARLRGLRHAAAARAGRGRRRVPRERSRPQPRRLRRVLHPHGVRRRGALRLRLRPDRGARQPRGARPRRGPRRSPTIWRRSTGTRSGIRAGIGGGCASSSARANASPASPTRIRSRSVSSTPVSSARSRRSLSDGDTGCGTGRSAFGRSTATSIPGTSTSPRAWISGSSTAAAARSAIRRTTWPRSSINYLSSSRCARRAASAVPSPSSSAFSGTATRTLGRRGPARSDRAPLRVSGARARQPGLVPQGIGGRAAQALPLHPVGSRSRARSTPSGSPTLFERSRP